MNSKRTWPLRLKFGVGFFATAALLWAWSTFVYFRNGFADWIPSQSLAAPSASHWLGFALYGQPVVELFLSGTKAVLLYGTLSVLISISIALILGFALATSRQASWFYRVTTYSLDVFGAVPGFLLSAVVLYACGTSLYSLVFAFAVANWDSSTRLAWSVGKLVVSRPSFLADTALGYTPRKLFWHHYVPETFGPLSSRFCSLLAFFIVFGASSVVIGVLDSQLFPWGILVDQGRHYFDVAPHVFWTGWLLIFASTFCLTMVSSGIHLLFEEKVPR